MDIAAERSTALRRLETLVRIESPSLDVPASEAVADRLTHWWRQAGAVVRTVRTDAGVTVIADLDGIGAPALLIGHGDTVWPRGTIDGELPWAVDGDVVRGPGAYDMKSGLVVMLAAVERLAGRRHRPVRAVIVCDEEIGSPTTQQILRGAAEGAGLAIGFESPHPDGALKVGRRGSTRLKLTVRGRAAHAALDPASGVSAVDELVDQLVALRRIVADPELPSEVLSNVGAVRGGSRTNVVPAEAEAEIGLRFIDPDTEERVLAAVRDLRAVREGAAVEWAVVSRRPAWRASAADEDLLARIARVGELLGQRVEGRPAAGAGDTNQVGNLGIPTVDGFGPRGGGAHALSEHVLLSSLGQRIELLEAVLRGEEHGGEHP